MHALVDLQNIERFVACQVISSIQSKLEVIFWYTLCLSKA